MDRLKNILVGVDFSDSSLRALEQAVRMAEWNGSSVHAVHVVSQRSQAYLPTDAEPKLSELISNLGVEEGAVTYEVLVGTLLAEILRLVRERSIDLLALGAYGALGQFTGSGVGAFASQAMRHVPCKVLAVHDGLRGSFHRILCAFDYSPTATRALEAALRLARQEGGELHVLHVPEDDEEAADSSVRLEAAVQRVTGSDSGLDIRCIVGKPREPRDGIIGYARKIEAHLIALGTRGQSNLDYVLMGATCERVLRAVRRSVLVTKPEGFVAPADRV